MIRNLTFLRYAVFAVGILLMAPSYADTLSLKDESVLIRIAFGSCIRGDLGQDFWDPILTADPDLFLFLGDNVYGDDEDPSLSVLQGAYDTLAAMPGYQRLRQSTPVMATWDDHDFGRNDGGRDYPHREKAEQIFEAFWGFDRKSEAANRPGIYHARMVGPPGQRVQIIMLDTRYFRSPLKRKERNAGGLGRYQPNLDPGADMLGDTQWAWLEERLREPADLRLIASSIQVIAEGHGWERWGNLPSERDRLYSLINETGAEGVILLSGDRHRAAFYRLDQQLSYPLYEVTSSSLNAGFAGVEPGPNRLGDEMMGEENFGLLVIDWSNREVRASLNKMTGEEDRHVEIDF